MWVRGALADYMVIAWVEQWRITVETARFYMLHLVISDLLASESEQNDTAQN